MLKSSRGQAQWWSNDYLIPTEDERKCVAYQQGCLWCSSAWWQCVLKWTRYGSPGCKNFGFSIQVAVLEVRKCDLGYYFIKTYKHFISFHVSFWPSSKLILTFTKWGGVACEITSVHGLQCNFRSRSTTSVNICFTSVPQSLLSEWMS